VKKKSSSTTTKSNKTVAVVVLNRKASCNVTIVRYVDLFLISNMLVSS
jgi:hypothetical protein